MADKANPVVAMRSITKRFLDVTANNKVNFDLFPGEICALLGENGAGKTTLMNILFGYYTCDEGEIFIKGKKTELTSPRDAISQGIGMIHQHFTLAPSQTVLENIIIATKSSKGLFLDLKAATERLLHLQERFGLQVDYQARVWSLSVGEQQKVEILKALYREVDILIMDEPTAVLAPIEIRELFKTLKSLVKENKSVIFISHKLNEVIEICDRILVLRSGEVVAEKIKKETSTRELVNLMVGREMLELLEKKKISAGEAVLEIKELTVVNDKGLEAVKKVDLLVRKKEIVGLAGVSGNGQSELCQGMALMIMLVFLLLTEYKIKAVRK
ncbi:Galactose/methyl galactoside import ATP-binding protein MglA [subsurface metagenome]